MRYLILVLIFFSTFILADTNRRIKTTYLDFLEPEGANDYKCTVQQGTQAGNIILTLPDTSDTLVGLATSDTLLNKTLTSPAINGGNITQVSTLSTGNQAPLKLYETGNTNYLGIKAPSSVTADVEFTLPDGDGENGQTLLTNGSGQLSWGASGDSSFKLQNFTTTTVTIKSGQMIINGLEYVTYDGAGTAETDFASDLVYTPSGLGVSQKYYLYIDTNGKSELTLDSGRIVQAIENDDFYISTSTPYGNDIDTSRYIALGLITTNGSSEIDAIYNIAFRYQDSWKEVNIDNEPCGVIKYSSVPLTEGEGYLLADGSAVSRTTYDCLNEKYSSEGYKHGVGDGSTTFNLPDLTGNVLVGQDTAQTEFDVIGETGGSKTMLDHVHNSTDGGTLTAAAQIQDAHTHYSVTASSISGGSAENIASGQSIAFSGIHTTDNNYNYVLKGTTSGTTKDRGITSSTTPTNNSSIVTGTIGTGSAPTSTSSMNPYIVERAYIKWTRPQSAITVATNSHRERITTKNTSGTDSKHQITLPSFMTDKTYAVNLTYHDDSASRDFDILGAVYDKSQTGYLTLNLDSITFSASDYLDVVVSYGAKAVGLPIDNETIVQESGKIKVAGVLDSNHYLNTSDFPDVTSLYGWNTFSGTYANTDTITGWISSNNLTVSDSNASGVSTVTDHLGNTSAIQLDGTDDYLVDANAGAGSAFNVANEDFTVSAWVKTDGLGANQCIASKYSSGSDYRSWIIYVDSSSIIFRIFTEGTGLPRLDVIIPNNILSDGNYHHIVGTYNYVSNTESWLTLYVDGKILGYTKSDGSTDSGNRYNDANSSLIFGGYDESGIDGLWAGDITEVFYKKTVLSANEIRKIYSAGSRKFVTQGGDDKVAILDGRQNNGYSKVGASQVTGLTNNAFADVAGYKFYAPETGFYRVWIDINVQLIDDEPDDTVIADVRLYNSTTSLTISNTPKRVGFYNHATDLGGDPQKNIPVHSEAIVYLTKDDEIDLQSQVNDATESHGILHNANTYESYIGFEKLD